jgi:hypothetical protein
MYRIGTKSSKGSSSLGTKRGKSLSSIGSKLSVPQMFMSVPAIMEDHTAGINNDTMDSKEVIMGQVTRPSANKKTSLEKARRAKKPDAFC